MIFSTAGFPGRHHFLSTGNVSRPSIPSTGVKGAAL